MTTTKFDISVIYIVSEHDLISEKHTQMVVDYNDGEGIGQSTMCIHEMLVESLRRQVGITWELVLVDKWFFTRHLMWDNYLFTQLSKERAQRPSIIGELAAKLGSTDIESAKSTSNSYTWKVVSLAPIYCQTKVDAMTKWTPERAKNTGILLAQGRQVVFLEGEAVLWHPWCLKGLGGPKSGHGLAYIAETETYLLEYLLATGGLGKWEFDIAQEREKMLGYFGNKNGCVRWMS